MYPYLSIDVIDQYYLDAANSKIIEGNQYLKSPDGKWGFLESIFYNGNGWRMKSILFKNFSNGEINELLSTSQGLYVSWLKDSNLLISRFNEKLKQSEFVSYNPNTGVYKTLALGRLYRYSLENGLILFAKNEPLRKKWIYDLKTGKERLLRDGEKEEVLFPLPIYQKIPGIPASIDLKTILTLKPVMEVKYEHMLKFVDKIVPVYYVFKRGERTFIPVRPLFEKLQLNIINSGGQTYLVNKSIKIKITKENSAIHHNRLFVTQEALESIGLPKFSIQN